jgi:hypothetical protein
MHFFYAACTTSCSPNSAFAVQPFQLNKQLLITNTCNLEFVQVAHLLGRQICHLIPKLVRNTSESATNHLIYNLQRDSNCIQEF